MISNNEIPMDLAANYILVRLAYLHLIGRPVRVSLTDG